MKKSTMMILKKIKIPNSARRIENLKVNFDVFKPKEGPTSFLERSKKIPNLHGYGDLWDPTLPKNIGLNQLNKSIDIGLPKLRSSITPTFARLSLHSQEWLKSSSYKERSLGAPIGLLSTKINRESSYNLEWYKFMMDPSQVTSSSMRAQIGDYLFSYLNYSSKVDKRDSSPRPTSGYCFGSSTLVSGLTLDSLGLRFLRKDFDLRCAIPLRFAHPTFNFGVSGDLTSWRCGFKNKPSSYYKVEPSSLMRLNFSGIGSSGLALNAFANISYDLPYKLLRDAGIYGHAFVSAESHTKLTDYTFLNFCFLNYFHSFRSYVGYGVIIPTKFFQIQVNYCYMLKQSKHDKGKTGFQLIFTSPK